MLCRCATDETRPPHVNSPQGDANNKQLSASAAARRQHAVLARVFPRRLKDLQEPSHVLIKLLKPEMNRLRQGCTCSRTDSGPDQTQGLDSGSGRTSSTRLEEPARSKTGIGPATRAVKKATRLIKPVTHRPRTDSSEQRSSTRCRPVAACTSPSVALPAERVRGRPDKTPAIPGPALSVQALALGRDVMRPSLG